MRRSSSFLLTVLLLATWSVGDAQGRKSRPDKPATVRAVNHPKMRAAIAALEAAKTELQNSGKDFGGHKKDAAEAVDNALKQLRLALQFERY